MAEIPLASLKRHRDAILGNVRACNSNGVGCPGASSRNEKANTQKADPQKRQDDPCHNATHFRSQDPSFGQ